MTIRHMFIVVALTLGSLPLAPPAARGADVLASCSACHGLTKPANTDIDRLMTRNGPDLYYAGVKFKKEWLIAWLQNPGVLRQGGVMFVRSVKAGPPGTADTIDTSKVPSHPKLSAPDAAAAADALMTLGVTDGLVQKGAFKQESANSMMASLLFNKLRGCSSCHSVKPGSGGVSGPELYTAGERLQPDYIVEYIRDPQKFDPRVWMPRLELTDSDIQKLTGYLTSLQPSGVK